MVFPCGLTTKTNLSDFAREHLGITFGFNCEAYIHVSLCEPHVYIIIIHTYNIYIIIYIYVHLLQVKAEVETNHPSPFQVLYYLLDVFLRK